MSDIPQEIPLECQLQAQAMHTIYSALGGMMVYGDHGPATTMDDLASVRQTRVFHTLEGRKYLYTTNVTVSVSRVELT